MNGKFSRDLEITNERERVFVTIKKFNFNLFSKKNLAHNVTSCNIVGTKEGYEMKDRKKRSFAIGELASLCGVTVRTLQYYDRMNLLNSDFTEGGRRTYTSDDILRLQQILFLKSFGFSLKEIGDKMSKAENSTELKKLFTRQREILLGQIEHLKKIVDELDTLIEEANLEEEITMNKLITILKLMKEGNPYTFLIRYFDDDQLKKIADRFDSSEESREFTERMEKMFARLDELYRNGADPAGEDGQKLAECWWKMTNEFAGDDSKLLETLVSAGKTTFKWPKEAVKIRESIENFLKKAFEIYFNNNSLKEIEKKGNKND